MLFMSDFFITSINGMPLMEVCAGRGTIASPWPPKTMPLTSSTETFSFFAMKLLYRDASRMPAMPMILFFGSFVAFIV